ncbi:MAG: hypothetical protein C0433_16305 [Cyclobacterium sp.]|nr:hypothetical protein [Cyclobacterium sp.]
MINFFDPSCQEAPRPESEFGICDGNPFAFTTTTNPDGWIAKVENKSGLPVVLTAIDGCVIKGNQLVGQRRCDCMLTTAHHLYFVELKEELKSWKSGAIEQLISTIEIFLKSHAVVNFKHKKAFACNRKSPRFQEIDHELNYKVFRKYGFRIDAQANVVLI